MKTTTSVVLILAASLWTSLALASNAYTKGEVNLRAGPSAEYPLVTQIPGDAFVSVGGCVDDFTWCDVDWEGNRGWVYANYLLYDFDNRRVPIIDYGPRLGLTIVLFSVNDYWGRYYPSRPWYRQREIWIHRPMPPRRPPPRPPHLRPPPRPQPQPTRPPRPPRPETRPMPGNPRPSISRPQPSPQPARPSPSNRPAPAVRPAPSVRPAPTVRPSPSVQPVRPGPGPGGPGPGPGARPGSRDSPQPR